MAQTTTEDLLLIQRLKKGDETAYAHLVDLHHQRLCTFANSLVNDAFHAEDIVQNVLMGVWRKRKTLPDRFNIKSFLTRWVYNEFIDQHRKNQSVLALEKKYIEGLDLVVEDPDTEGIERLLALVKREIQHLPPKCREIFVLSRQEGLTNIEISDYLKISTKTVEGHMTRAFAILRKKVGDKTDLLLFLLFGPYRRMA